MLTRGMIVDRYSVEEQLGEGGWGSVFAARDLRLNRHVAIKVIRLDTGLKTSVAAARLLREARAVASFEHPNAVTIFDVGEIEGTPYIVMELVPGRPLDDYIGAPADLWRTKLAWLVDVARALAAAHAAGLVHRDVKPANVIVRPDGFAKVLDFGIARRTRGGAPDSGHRVIPEGTPLYMSPEALRGEPLDGRSDQFSWGVSAYHLLGGVAPWPENAGVHVIAASIMMAEALPLRALAPAVPPPVLTAVARAMEKEREARFDCMSEIVSLLEPLVAGSFPVPPAVTALRPTLRGLGSERTDDSVAS
ncbi:MAG: serine/threonine protein kinase [Myxococcales bacterium]|nr:serine/threonine protein kinase [Myxococcales bacterium]